ncbi:MAG: flippase-like domain-containing protein [Clostridiales bacterium]|nr:flippase-like domain-containing protein [Clostridiales bacterium]
MDNLTTPPTINRIDVDEKTSEPIIVEVSKKELLAQDKKEKKQENTAYNKYDFVERKTDKSIGEQLKMSRLFQNAGDEKYNKRQRTFKYVSSAIFILFVLLVLAFTAYQDFFNASEQREPFSWSSFLDIISKSWIYLVFAIVSLALCFLFKGLKLSILCKSMTDKFHFRTCFETGIIGHYYNNVTPLAVGGQPFEIYHLSKHGIHGGVATSLPIATFFLNQLAFALLALFSLALISLSELYAIFPSVLKILAIIGLFCCMVMPTLVIIFSLKPRVGGGIVKWVINLGAKMKIVKRPELTTYKTMKTVVHNAKCIKKMTTRPLAFLLSFLISLFEHLASASIAFFSLKFFGFDLPSIGILEWLFIIQAYFILTASITFIPTPGNSGAADLSFFALFKQGLAAGLAFPAMILWRGLGFYSYIIIGFLFATLKKKSDNRKKLKNQSVT